MVRGEDHLDRPPRRKHPRSVLLSQAKAVLLSLGAISRWAAIAKMLIAIIPRCARTGQSPRRNCCALVATNTLVAPVGAFGIRWRGGELDDADVSRIVERRRSQLPKPKGFALPSGYAPSPGAALSAPNFQMKNQGGKFSVTPVSRDVCAEKPPVSERTIPGVVAFWRILRVIGRRRNARSPFTGILAVGLQPSVRRLGSRRTPRSLVNIQLPPGSFPSASY